MNMNWATNRLTGVVLFLCWLALASRGANADDKVDGRDKIKELQKQRLEAATKARDFLMEQDKKGYFPPGVDKNGFLGQLVETNMLVFQARLDLCDGKLSRLKAIEETIKDVEPLVARLEGNLKAGIANAPVPYRLAQVHLLELKIALEKAKQESGGK